MFNYTYVTASPKSELAHKWRNALPEKDIVTFLNNKDGLPQVYNGFLNSREWDKNDRVVFLHDDCYVEDVNIRDKLDESFQKYDVVGLAGGLAPLKRTPQSLWHVMSDKHSGCVNHTDGKRVWTNVFGPNDKYCALLDGLFLGVNPLLLQEKSVTFDEDFGFHHYDLSFCMRCNKAGLTLGTSVQLIHVIHEGLGEYNNDSWEKSDVLFRKKYY